jgi:hypothetical protein
MIAMHTGLKHSGTHIQIYEISRSWGGGGLDRFWDIHFWQGNTIVGAEREMFEHLEAPDFRKRPFQSLNIKRPFHLTLLFNSQTDLVQVICSFPNTCIAGLFQKIRIFKNNIIQSVAAED